MIDVFAERTFDPSLVEADVFNMALQAGGCFNLHRVDWVQSYLSIDGGEMVCWFRAPDAESARIAFRQMNADASRVWSGSIHEAPDLDAGSLAKGNVVVERSFATPVQLEDIQAIEDTGAWCLETHRVKFLQTFFSMDRTRMICLYTAPDAESVRLAQRQAEMPVDRVWAFQPILPEKIPG